jgi:glycine betaine/proline transport system substrate-binding protein
MGKMITEVDLNGKKVEEVVAAWMAANEPTWSAWIKN